MRKTTLIDIAIGICGFSIGFFIVGPICLALLPEAPPVASPPPPAAIDHSLRICAEIVGVMAGDPETAHVLTCLFAGSGSVEILMRIPAFSDWDTLTETEIQKSISAAINRGAVNFQLITFGEEPGTIANK